MKIRKTTEEDFVRVMEIYAAARDFMARTGNPNQWGLTHWPPEALIHDDIKEGSSDVCVNDDGKVVAVFYYVQGKDIEPIYRDITEGAWLNDSAYGVIHRIASDGTEKGIGRFCINWASKQCSHLRIDTHPDNKVMQNLLSGLGFVRCGIVHVEEDDHPRYAYERIQV